MKIGHNLLAALASSLWTAALGIAVIPLYLKYLGLESYGLIGFFTTMQALFLVLDMGLAQTINREVARLSASGEMPQARNLLHTLAILYVATALVIAALVIAAAPTLASSWVRAQDMQQPEISRSIALMGLVLACRWPIGLYQGALIGMQRLTLSSRVNIAVVTLQTVGAVGVLALISPTIEAFFIWQAAISLIHLALMRRAAWFALGREETGAFNPRALKRLWRFSLSVGGITISALVLSQLDKVLLSKFLTLEEFGIYMLAAAVVSSLYVIISPVFNVIYPLFSTLVAKGDMQALAANYRQGTRALATVIFPAALVLVIVPKSLVHLWTGQELVAARVAPLIAIMAVGSALHGIMYFPYALQLASGMPRLALITNFVLMLVLVPLTYSLTLRFGALGGAVAWLSFHILYLFFGTWLTNRHLLKGEGATWISIDVGGPLFVTAAAGLAAVAIYQAMLSKGVADLLQIALAGGVALIAVLASAYFVPVSKEWLMSTLIVAKGSEP